MPSEVIGAAQILVATETVDEGKAVKCEMSCLLRLSVPLIILLDSCDLFNSLSTPRNSTNKSIREDVICTKQKYKMGHANEVVCIPERVSLADPGTETDSLLTRALLHTPGTGTIAIDLTLLDSRRHAASRISSKRGWVWDLIDNDKQF